MKQRDGEKRPSLNKPAFYSITIQGVLGPNWSAQFEGLALSRDPGSGTTNLKGMIADQAELHSLLQTLHDLNLMLLSVKYEGSAEEDSPRSGEFT